MAKPPAQKLKVMVSSTVYGNEALLDRVFALLKSFGYTVWSSHAGTLPIIPHASAYETCLAAVEACDVFFGIIMPQYGSGTDGAGGPSITHRELMRAIELDKPRFMLAHDQVVLARRFLMDLGFADTKAREQLKLTKRNVIGDLRVLDMYEAATREDLPIAERTGNWVQKYQTDLDVVRYVEEQFSRKGDLQAFVDRWRAKKDEAS